MLQFALVLSLNTEILAEFEIFFFVFARGSKKYLISKDTLIPTDNPGSLECFLYGTPCRNDQKMQAKRQYNRVNTKQKILSTCICLNKQQ